MRLNDLKAPVGANKKRKRLVVVSPPVMARPPGAVAKARRPHREGQAPPRFRSGQMPMYRRMPKRGFVNAFAIPVVAINVDTLANRFNAGATVDLQALRSQGLATTRDHGVRVLGAARSSTPSLSRPSLFRLAKQKIEAAGGQAIGLAPVAPPKDAPAPATA